MEGEKYVFISYSRRHAAPPVERLTHALNDRGVRVWQDVNEIHAGENWQRAIEEGFRNAAAVIYISSYGSLDSHWKNSSLEEFLAKGKPVVPIIVDESGREAMPEALHNIQWLDLRKDFERGVDRILEMIGDRIKPGAPVARKQQKSKGYVFINYAEEDSDFVRRLRLFLKDHGYAYWDYEDSDRNYQSQLFLELEEVISNAAATLTVLSNAWKRSKWTVKEYFFSEEVAIPVFLLRAKPIGPTLAVAGIPYIDFVADAEAGFAKLDRELQRKRL